MGRRIPKATRGVKRTCPSCGNGRALVHRTDPQYYPVEYRCRGCGHTWKAGHRA